MQNWPLCTKGKGILYHGNNLTLLRNLQGQSIDLIYADVPFNTGRKYSLIEPPSQKGGCITKHLCFADTWGTIANFTNQEAIQGEHLMCDKWPEATRRYGHIQVLAMEQGRSLRNYLDYLFPRILELERVLSPKGSIYIHCNQRVSHYLKLTMDAIFGQKNFKSEIVWQKHKGGRMFGGNRRCFNCNTDIILFYAKGANHYFCHKNPPTQETTKPNLEGSKKKAHNITRITLSRTMARQNLIYEYRNYIPPYGWSIGRKKLEQLDKEGLLYWSRNGKPYAVRKNRQHKSQGQQNLWLDIENDGKTRNKYPTQKPLELLSRIIKTSCPPNGTVLDPFCGSGTTAVASSMLGRKWIGCDQSSVAIKITQAELLKFCNTKPGTGYTIITQEEELSKTLQKGGYNKRKRGQEPKGSSKDY